MTRPAHAPDAAAAAASRLVGVDAFRGLIVAVMAIDHASLFVARQHAAEFWGTALPRYPDAVTMLTRNVTHLCAPGFFLLLGTGMALFAASRTAAGWTSARIARAFVTRGLVLVALQLLVENPAWAIGLASAAPGAALERGGGVPGQGGPVLLHLGVLYGLGTSMVFLGLLLRAPTRLLLLLAVALTAITHLAVPGPAHAGGPFSRIEMALVLPARQGAVQVFYPALPWMAVSACGVVLGRAILADRDRALRATLPAGIAALMLFAALRFAGVGDPHRVGAGWMGFLTVTKYPPSIAFLLLELGIDLVLLGAIAHAPASALDRVARPLLAFGRAPLFFYVAHLYLYAAIGLLFPRGTSLAAVLPVWLLGLALLYPACRWYDLRRRRTGIDSLWRLL